MKAHDISGFPIFSDGELGLLHQIAHRLKDLGRYEEGYATLSRELRGRNGSGSQWSHVQWHLMVFELATGRWHDAHDRFLTHVLPAQVDVREASVDAPSALWRLQLDAPEEVALPWRSVRDCAAELLDRTADPYVVLHHLLAFAGAGDVAGIDRFLADQSRRKAADAQPAALVDLGRALRALTVGDHSLAVSYFERGLPGLDRLGGSRAQNQLLHRLYCVAYEGLSAYQGATTPVPAGRNAAFVRRRAEPNVTTATSPVDVQTDLAA